MIVWLLDTEGPRTVAGVTDSEAKAISDAEELLTEGQGIIRAATPALLLDAIKNHTAAHPFTNGNAA
jgi:hypothetical protein